MCAASGGASSHYTFLAGNLTADTWRLLLSVRSPVFSERILPGYSFLNYCVLQWAI